MTTRIEKGPGWELRCGDYRDVLDGVRCAAAISDPPYSERTHAAQRSDAVAKSKSFSELGYESWSQADVEHWVGFVSEMDPGWVAVFSDHALQIVYERELERSGLYVFAPIPQVTINRSVRLAGDGPACWTTWITTARKRCRPFSKWGALPGAYVDDVGQREPGVVQGAKQLHTMRAIVRDYTRPGDLVCDTCAGGATTLLAAAIEGRRAIGAEIDEETFDKAVRRLRRGYTPTMFAEVAA
jgi:site-specific DNA-methyltransferase (adenine-specific)